MTYRPLKRGPKGGVYYISRSGSRVYVDRSSLPVRVKRSSFYSPNPPEIERTPIKPGGFGLLDIAGVVVFLVVVVPIISLIG